MENTYVENSNVELQYPYAAKDTNQKLYLVLGPQTMTPANVLRIDSTAIVPLLYTSTQINLLTLVPEGVTITMKVNPQFEEPPVTP
ncbi:MAG: hypothetical protein WC358_10555 [Ignavibacteria bacterium]|jgi:hypothetical protein